MDDIVDYATVEAFKQRQNAPLESARRNTKRSSYGRKGGSGLSRWEERMTLRDYKKTVRAGSSRRRQTQNNKGKKEGELMRFCSVYVKR